MCRDLLVEALALRVKICYLLGDAHDNNAPIAGATRRERITQMIDETYQAVKSDFIMALRIIYREGLSDAFAHLSAAQHRRAMR